MITKLSPLSPAYEPIGSVTGATIQLEAQDVHQAPRGRAPTHLTCAASVTRRGPSRAGAWRALVAREPEAAVALLVEDGYDLGCAVSASEPRHVRRLQLVGAIELHEGGRGMRKRPRGIQQQLEPPLHR